MDLSFTPDVTRDPNEPLPERSTCRGCGKPLKSTDYRILYELCTPCLVPLAKREQRAVNAARKVVRDKREGK